MWDERVPEEVCNEWESWRTWLFDLEKVKFKRMFVSTSFSSAKTRKIHIYSDSSEKAIAAVGYIQLDDDKNFGFVMGKAKVAPNHGHTLPRLELCGVLLATEIGHTISDQLDIPLSDIQYYTDSKVVHLQFIKKILQLCFKPCCENSYSVKFQAMVLCANRWQPSRSGDSINNSFEIRK